MKNGSTLHVTADSADSAKDQGGYNVKSVKKVVDTTAGNPPFEGGHKVKQHKDRFGNVIKTKNVARHLARQAMNKMKNEEVELDETKDPRMGRNKPGMDLYAKVQADDQAHMKKQDEKTEKLLGPNWKKMGYKERMRAIVQQQRQKKA